MSAPMQRGLAVMAVLCLFLAAGCSSKKSVVVLMPEADGAVGQVEVRSEAGSQRLDQPYQSVEVKPGGAPGDPVFLTRDQVDAEFGPALAAQPEPPVSFLLYFFSGETDLTPESQAEIPSILATIRSRQAPDISIIGHSDRKGSEDYNLTLSLSRAEEVRKQLVQGGVDADAIEVTSHGEANPIVPTEDDVAEPRNRRVEVIVR